METAIRVCKQVGYFNLALYLAEKHREHEAYLKIQIDDCANFKDALNYVRALEFSAVGALFVRSSARSSLLS